MASQARKYTPLDFRARLLKVQQLRHDAQLDVLLCVLGEDGADEAGCTWLWNWLFRGLSGWSVFTTALPTSTPELTYAEDSDEEAPLAELKDHPTIEDAWFTLRDEALVIFCPVADRAGLVQLTSHSPTPVEIISSDTLKLEANVDARESLKVAAFLCSGLPQDLGVGFSLGVPLSPDTAAMAVARAEKNRREIENPLTLELERWPLVQSYGLDIFGRGFLSLRTQNKIVDVHALLMETCYPAWSAYTLDLAQRALGQFTQRLEKTAELTGAHGALSLDDAKADYDFANLQLDADEAERVYEPLIQSVDDRDEAALELNELDGATAHLAVPRWELRASRLVDSPAVRPEVRRAYAALRETTARVVWTPDLAGTAAAAAQAASQAAGAEVTSSYGCISSLGLPVAQHDNGYGVVWLRLSCKVAGETVAYGDSFAYCLWGSKATVFENLTFPELPPFLWSSAGAPGSPPAGSEPLYSGSSSTTVLRSIVGRVPLRTARTSVELHDACAVLTPLRGQPIYIETPTYTVEDGPSGLSVSIAASAGACAFVIEAAPVELTNHVVSRGVAVSAPPAPLPVQPARHAELSCATAFVLSDAHCGQPPPPKTRRVAAAKANGTRVVLTHTVPGNEPALIAACQSAARMRGAGFVALADVAQGAARLGELLPTHPSGVVVAIVDASVHAASAAAELQTALPQQPMDVILVGLGTRPALENDLTLAPSPPKGLPTQEAMNWRAWAALSRRGASGAKAIADCLEGAGARGWPPRPLRQFLALPFARDPSLRPAFLQPRNRGVRRLTVTGKFPVIHMARLAEFARVAHLLARRAVVRPLEELQVHSAGLKIASPTADASTSRCGTFAGDEEAALKAFDWSFLVGVRAAAAEGADIPDLADVGTTPRAAEHIAFASGPLAEPSTESVMLELIFAPPGDEVSTAHVTKREEEIVQALAGIIAPRIPDVGRADAIVLTDDEVYQRSMLPDVATQDLPDGWNFAGDSWTDAMGVRHWTHPQSEKIVSDMRARIAAGHAQVEEGLAAYVAAGWVRALHADVAGCIKAAVLPKGDE